MVYTQSLYPPDPTEFPPPPTWMVWIDEGSLRSKLLGKGQVRSMETLYKAVLHVKKRVIPYGDGVKAQTSWRIYEWAGDHYEVRHQGEAGEPLDSIQIFKRGAVKDRSIPTQKVTDDMMAEVLASIRGEVS